MNACRQVGIAVALCLMSVAALPDTLCFSPVKEKPGDKAPDNRSWLEPFDYRVQVDDGPIIEPAEDTSTPYEFDSEQPLVKIWLGDELVESFYVSSEDLADGRNCLWFYSMYETWSITDQRSCSCDEADTENPSPLREDES